MMHWSDLFNSGAALFIVATPSTQTMVPLRLLPIPTKFIPISEFTPTLFLRVGRRWGAVGRGGLRAALHGRGALQMGGVDREGGGCDPGKPVPRLPQAVHAGASLPKGFFFFRKGQNRR